MDNKALQERVRKLEEEEVKGKDKVIREYSALRERDLKHYQALRKEDQNEDVGMDKKHINKLLANAGVPVQVNSDLKLVQSNNQNRGLKHGL